MNFDYDCDSIHENLSRYHDERLIFYQPFNENLRRLKIKSYQIFACSKIKYLSFPSLSPWPVFIRNYSCHVTLLPKTKRSSRRYIDIVEAKLRTYTLSRTTSTALVPNVSIWYGNIDLQVLYHKVVKLLNCRGFV